MRSTSDSKEGTSPILARSRSLGVRPELEMQANALSTYRVRLAAGKLRRVEKNAKRDDSYALYGRLQAY